MKTPKRSALMLVLLVLAGCGSSSTSSPTTTTATAGKPSYCAAITNLEASVKALSQVHPVKNGTSALKSAFDKVKTDAQTVVTEVKGSFSSQIDALKKAVSSLGNTVKEGNLKQVPAQVSAVSTAVKNLAAAASPKCG